MTDRLIRQVPETAQLLILATTAIFSGTSHRPAADDLLTEAIEPTSRLEVNPKLKGHSPQRRGDDGETTDARADDLLDCRCALILRGNLLAERNRSIEVVRKHDLPAWR